MKTYYEFLYRLRADGIATRSTLECRGGGRFRQQIDECLHLGYIMLYDIIDNNEPRYCLTELGKRYLDEP